MVEKKFNSGSSTTSCTLYLSALGERARFARASCVGAVEIRVLQHRVVAWGRATSMASARCAQQTEEKRRPHHE